MKNSKQKKIVHIIAGLRGGGRERRMLELVRSLVLQNNFKQYIILLDNHIDYPVVYTTNAKIIIVDYKSKWKTIKELVKVLSAIKPTILHVWTEIHYVLCLIALLKPLVGYKLIIGFLADGNPIRTNLCRFSYKLSYWFADNIVSNSKAGLIAKEAITEKSKVIYNGFTFSRFEKFKNYNKEQIKKELGIESSIVVSMMARFNPAKDWDTFLKIAEQVQQQNVDVVFLAVGQGELHEHYHSMANEMNLRNVVFTGFRKDIDRLLFVSDICLLCTNEKVHAEGVSNSIMEAMAAGKPIIATSGGGTAEIISNAIDGYIISPSDYMMGTELLLRLLHNKTERNTISMSAKRKIEINFSLEKMVSEYVDMYNQLLKK